MAIKDCGSIAVSRDSIPIAAILQHIRVVKEKPGLSFMYMWGRCPFICKLMAGNYGYGNITKYVTGLYS